MEILTTLANWAQIIGLPLAIIAIIVSIWLYRKGRQKRAISCVFDSVASPIEIKAGEALKGEIEIRYMGRAVENLFVVRARLKNAGNLPIRKVDFVTPIRFTFAPGAEFVRPPLIAEKRPKDLGYEWNFSAVGNPPVVNTLSVMFDLLNPGDELIVEFVCTGDSKTPTVSARIEGVSQIDVIDPDEVSARQELRRIASDVRAGIVAIAVSGAIFAWFISGTSEPSRGLFSATMLFALLVTSVAFFAPGIVRTLRIFKRRRK